MVEILREWDNSLIDIDEIDFQPYFNLSCDTIKVTIKKHDDGTFWADIVTEIDCDYCSYTEATTSVRLPEEWAMDLINR